MDTIWTAIRTIAGPGQAAEGTSAPVSAIALVAPGPMAEVRLVGASLTGSPTSVTFGIWRDSAGVIDKLGTWTVPAAAIASSAPQVYDLHGSLLFVTIESFVGGTTPKFIGTIEARPIHSSVGNATEAQENAFLGSIDGKFPAAAALSDSAANPTTTTIGAVGLFWDVVGAVIKRVPGWNVANDALTDMATAIPAVGSFLVAWDNGNSKWRRLKTDTGGSLKTRNLDANGSASFPDNATPADATAYGSLTKVLTKLVASNGTTDDMVRAGLSTVQTAFTGMLNTLPFGKFNLTRPVLADTNGLALQLDQNGALRVVEQAAPDYEDGANDVAWTQERAVADTSALAGGWTPYHSGTTKVGTAGIVIKASSGRLRRIYGTNSNATITYYLVLVNKATAPVNGDAVLDAIALTGTTASWNDSEDGREYAGGKVFTTGIAYAISTTPYQVTLAGALDCTVSADFA